MRDLGKDATLRLGGNLTAYNPELLRSKDSKCHKWILTVSPWVESRDAAWKWGESSRAERQRQSEMKGSNMGRPSQGGNREE